MGSGDCRSPAPSLPPGSSSLLTLFLLSSSLAVVFLFSSHASFPSLDSPRPFPCLLCFLFLSAKELDLGRKTEKDNERGWSNDGEK